jgi:hypothetical protein
MRKFRVAVIAASVCAVLGALQPLSAPAAGARIDPLISVEQNRADIVGGLVAQWRDQFASGKEVELRNVLMGLRADKLLAVSAVQDPKLLATVLERGDFLALFPGNAEALPGDGAALTDMPSGGKALGSASIDVVYTPVTPCRLYSTFGAGAALPTGTTFGINVRRTIAPAGACGIPTTGVTGVLVTLVAANVVPATGGYVQLLQPASSSPAAAMTFNVGQVFASANTVVPTATNGSFDIVVGNTGAEVLVDVFGYFAAPIATALQCTDTANNSVTGIVAGGTANVVAPACPAGYTQTATNCESSSWLVPFVFFHAGTCSARNNDTTAQDIRASRTCCRVPGR